MRRVHSARAAKPTGSRNRTAPAPVTDAELATIGPLIPAFLRAEWQAAPAVPEILKAMSLGRRHLNVLVILSLSGPINVGELSRRLGVAHATASLLVGELSRAGVVQRAEDEADRRRTIVSLAEKHRREIMEFLTRRTGFARQALSALTPSERAAFVKGMRAMISALEATRRAEGL